MLDLGFVGLLTIWSAGVGLWTLRRFRSTPEHPADAADDRGLEHHDAAPLGGRGEFVPPSLSLERRVRAVSREVLLVTYSSERRALVTVQNPTAGTQ